MHSGGGCEKCVAHFTFNDRPVLHILITSLYNQHKRIECTPISDNINGLRKAIMSSQGQQECQNEQV
jgi:hypothetical protein